MEKTWNELLNEAKEAPQIDWEIKNLLVEVGEQINKHLKIDSDLASKVSGGIKAIKDLGEDGYLDKIPKKVRQIDYKALQKFTKKPLDERKALAALKNLIYAITGR